MHFYADNNPSHCKPKHKFIVQPDFEIYEKSLTKFSPQQKAFLVGIFAEMLHVHEEVIFFFLIIVQIS